VAHSWEVERTYSLELVGGGLVADCWTEELDPCPGKWRVAHVGYFLVAPLASMVSSPAAAELAPVVQFLAGAADLHTPDSVALLPHSERSVPANW